MYLGEINWSQDFT